MLKHARCMVVAATCAAMTLATPSIDALGQERPSPLDQLPSEGMIAMPADMSELVRRADAAVIGEVVGVGELVLEDRFSTDGTRLGAIGLAPYRVRISEVVFNKLNSAAPSLAAGSEVNLFKEVGGPEAKAFLAKNTRVATKDECLLFLSHNGRGSRWSLAPWQVQFRKSRVEERSAEIVLPAPDMNWLEGGALAVTRVENQTTVD